MDTLIFATNNANKVTEVRHILKGSYKVLSLAEAGINIDIPEPFDTLEENAVEKTRVIFEITGKDCFAEDTGLRVEALNGEPGVKSARYAGENKNMEANIDKLLDRLKNHTIRSSQFKTVVSLILNGKQNIFDGTSKGTIIAQRRGVEGFGYDSVFVPDGSQKTFAEMTLEEKSEFSHRRMAINKLLSFLKEHEAVQK